MLVEVKNFLGGIRQTFFNEASMANLLVKVNGAMVVGRLVVVGGRQVIEFRSENERLTGELEREDRLGNVSATVQANLISIERDGRPGNTADVEVPPMWAKDP
jgi:hypothetical protein